MKPLSHHLHTVRQQPPHVRKQVTFTLAAGATALIALVWLVASLSTGAWRIEGASFATQSAQQPAATGAGAGSAALLGGAAAALTASSSASRLEVVGNAHETPPAPPAAEPTVVPF
jgi:hypothetical protein